MRVDSGTALAILNVLSPQHEDRMQLWNQYSERTSRGKVVEPIKFNDLSSNALFHKSAGKAEEEWMLRVCLVNTDLVFSELVVTCCDQRVVYISAPNKAQDSSGKWLRITRLVNIPPFMNFVGCVSSADDKSFAIMAERDGEALHQFLTKVQEDIKSSAKLMSFQSAVNVMSLWNPNLNDMYASMLYASYSQVTDGNMSDAPKERVNNLRIGYRKAWKMLNGKSREEAEKEYIKIVNLLIAEMNL